MIYVVKLGSQLQIDKLDYKEDGRGLQASDRLMFNSPTQHRIFIGIYNSMKNL